MKNDKSVKIAVDSWKELLNHISVEITRERTVQLFISKIDLDNAYRQMKPSVETIRQYVFALTGGNSADTTNSNKGFYGLSDIHTRFQEKLTEYSDTVHQVG